MSYSIVFSGKIRDGATLAETRHNLAEMFKIGDPAVLDRVFSGKPAILRKNLDEDEARKQEMILYMAGAVCELRNNAPPPPAPEPAPPPAPEPAPAAPPAPPPRATHIPAPAPPLPAAPAMTMAAAGGLALVPDSPPAPAESQIVPAALRGHERDVEMEQRALDSAGKVVVTHHGRDGEALLDPLQAPWDPSFMPDGVKGLSWAGFMAPLLWGTFNGLRLSFLPLIGIRLFRAFVPPWVWGLFYLAFGAFYLVKGRQLAWENKQWRNGEHFNRVQRWWTFGSLAFFLLFAYGIVHLTLQQRRGDQLMQAMANLAVAEAAVIHATDPQAHGEAVAARAKAREAVLASIDDPAVRESERQTFAEEDREEQRDAQPGQEPEPEPQPQS